MRKALLNKKQYVFKIPENIKALIEDAKRDGKILYNKYYQEFLEPLELVEQMEKGSYHFNPKGWVLYSRWEVEEYYNKMINEISLKKEKTMNKLTKISTWQAEQIENLLKE